MWSLFATSTPMAVTFHLEDKRPGAGCTRAGNGLLSMTLFANASMPTPKKPNSAQGMDGFQVIAWNGLYAPRGTPAAIVQRLNAELTKVLGQPEVMQRLLDLGHEPAGGSPAELAEFARSERHKWAPLIERAGLKAD